MVDFEWNDTGVLPQLPVRQVYCWVFDSAQQVLIVSKNGEQWQLPGGKPERGETPQDTLQRELYEETGLNLADFGTKPTYIGHYVVAEPNAPQYAQLRYKLTINMHFDQLALTANNDDEIKFVKTVPISGIATYLPWLVNSDELKAATL